jgi:hypothetical protein
MQITIKIINQAPPAATADQTRAGQSNEPVIQLTAEDWSSRQTALHTKAA